MFKASKEKLKALSNEMQTVTGRLDRLERNVGKIFDFMHQISNTYVPTGYLQKDLEAIKEYLGIEVVGIPARRVAKEIDENDILS